MSGPIGRRAKRQALKIRNEIRRLDGRPQIVWCRRCGCYHEKGCKA